MRLCIGAFAAALLLVAAGGCGGGDDETTGATTAPPPVESTAEATTTVEETTAAETRPEPPEDQGRWAQQVDAACTPWQAKIDAVAPPATATDLERWLGEALPLIRKQVAAVEAVKPPTAAATAEQATVLVSNLRIVERALTHYRAALRTGDADAAKDALAAAGAAGIEARTTALAVGVTECGGYSSG